MFFWNIKALRDSLKEKSLPQYSAFLYLLIYVFFMAILTEMDDSEKTMWGFISSYVYILSVTLGTLYCYLKNGGSEGSNFIERYFSIGFVVNLRLFVIFFLPLIIAVALFFILSGNDMPPNESWHDPIFELLLNLLIYWRIGYHIGHVAKKTEALMPVE